MKHPFACFYEESRWTWIIHRFQQKRYTLHVFMKSPGFLILSSISLWYDSPIGGMNE